MTTKRKGYRDIGPSLRVDLSKSVSVGVGILLEARVPFALCGSLASWQYLPPSKQVLTKDVDFAVPHGRDFLAAKVAAEKGYRVEEIEIGGYSVKGQQVLVGFVSRRVYHAKLFAEAVSKAKRFGKMVVVDGVVVPVVPIEYLIAMKLLTFRHKDDVVAEMLIEQLLPRELRRLEAIMVKFIPHLLGKLNAILRR